jgi:hypothetical protein
MTTATAALDCCNKTGSESVGLRQLRRPAVGPPTDSSSITDIHERGVLVAEDHRSPETAIAAERACDMDDAERSYHQTS